jgi:hypothetical protein
MKILIKHFILSCFLLLESFNVIALDNNNQFHNTLTSYVSIQVNVDEFGQNIVGDAANEPSITVNPNDPDNIVIGWRQFDTVLSNFRQAGWAYSNDAGMSWNFPGVLTPGDFRSDPVLDVDSFGNFYYQTLHFIFKDNIYDRSFTNFEKTIIEVFKSTDGGLTWQDPVFSFGEGGDKNWMVIDRSGGLSDGHIYGTWVFGTLNRFTRSIDQGNSFEAPVRVPLYPSFGTMAIGPDGEVYIVGNSSKSRDLERIPNSTNKVSRGIYIFSKSKDAQLPTVTPTLASIELDMGGSATGYVDGNTPNRLGLLGQVNVAVDHSEGPNHGNIYVLASVDPPGIDNRDVHIIRSSDVGNTWSEPVRVNNDPPNANSWQWFGAHAVSPNSRIDVIWNDTRNSDELNISELFYAYSWDAGETWSGNIAVSPKFDSYVGFPDQEKIGDYYTLVADEEGVNVAYAATFNGEQDIYFVRLFPDCNENKLSDVTDIDQRTSEDTNTNHIPDECEFLKLPGDLDEDGDIDRSDLDILFANRNLRIENSSCGESCDLDDNGVINNLDLRKLVLLCTRPRCVTK